MTAARSVSAMYPTYWTGFCTALTRLCCNFLQLLSVVFDLVVHLISQNQHLWQALNCVFMVLQNVQSLNVKCGLPPIPNASAAGGAASPDAISSGLGATVGATVATPPVVAPAAPQTTIITGGNSGSLSAGAPPADATGASTSAAAEGQAQGEWQGICQLRALEQLRLHREHIKCTD